MYLTLGLGELFGSLLLLCTYIEHLRRVDRIISPEIGCGAASAKKTSSSTHPGPQTTWLLISTLRTSRLEWSLSKRGENYRQIIFCSLSQSNQISII